MYIGWNQTLYSCYTRAPCFRCLCGYTSMRFDVSSSFRTISEDFINPATPTESTSDPKAPLLAYPSARAHTQSAPHSGRRSPSSPMQFCRVVQRSCLPVLATIEVPRTHCACSCTFYFDPLATRPSLTQVSAAIPLQLQLLICQLLPPE